MERPIDRGHAAPTERLSAGMHAARVVLVSAGLHLGLGDHELLEMLALGFTLSDTAELGGCSFEGLQQAIAAALYRTGLLPAPRASEVAHLVAVIEAPGDDAWTRVVAGVIHPQVDVGDRGHQQTSRH
jgi:hypothetical protein